MKTLNFYERAVLWELVKQSEEGVLSRSYQQIANEIGGITYQSIKNYLDRFIAYGVVVALNKGTHRQMFKFDVEAVNKLLG